MIDHSIQSEKTQKLASVRLKTRFLSTLISSSRSETYLGQVVRKNFKIKTRMKSYLRSRLGLRTLIERVELLLGIKTTAINAMTQRLRIPRNANFSETVTTNQVAILSTMIRYLTGWMMKTSASWRAVKKVSALAKTCLASPTMDVSYRTFVKTGISRFKELQSWDWAII